MLTFLVAHPWISPAVLGVLVLLGPLVGSWLVDRPRWAWALAALAMVSVFAFTLAPQGGRQLAGGCTLEWGLPTPRRVEPMANVVLFVAPVLFAGVASRRPVLAFAAGSALALGIEAAQAVAPAIGRSCASEDWLSNTIGSALGAILAAFALLLSRYLFPTTPGDGSHRDRPGAPTYSG
jgi:hypothetical protein